MAAADNILVSGTPARVAADRIVSKRLKKTADLLNRVASGAEITAADVHKLRVSTRRADAALRAFREVTRKTPRKRLRGTLRGLRRAAGLARQCDVHRAMLTDVLSADTPETASAIGYLAARIGHEAEHSRELLLEHARSVSPRAVCRSTTDLFKLGKSRPTYADIATDALNSASRRVLSASDDDLRDFANLHALRIACKRLRYSIEIFRPCLTDEQAMSALDALTEIQNRLGNLNDLQDLRRRVESEASRFSDLEYPRIVLTGLTWMRADLHERQNMQRAKFLRWWSGALESVQDSVRRASEGIRIDSGRVIVELPEP